MHTPNTINIGKNGSKKEQEPIPIKQIYQRDKIAHIIKHSRKIESLDHYFKQHIAPDWQTFYHVLNIKGNTLVIGTAGSAAIYRLKLLSNEFLSRLSQGPWKEITRLHFILTPKLFESPKKSTSESPKKIQRPGSNTLSQLEAIAQDLPEPLKSSWIRLNKQLKGMPEASPSPAVVK